MKRIKLWMMANEWVLPINRLLLYHFMRTEKDRSWSSYNHSERERKKERVRVFEKKSEWKKIARRRKYSLICCEGEGRRVSEREKRFWDIFIPVGKTQWYIHEWEGEKLESYGSKRKEGADEGREKKDGWKKKKINLWGDNFIHSLNYINYLLI